MRPPAAGKEIEAAIVAADLIRAEQDAIGVTDENLPSLVATLGDLARDPPRRAAIEHQVGELVEEVL